jgi:serine/threonine-protein kinase RsbW
MGMMKLSRHFTAELKNLAAIRQFVEEQAEAFETNPDAIPDIIQAVDESTTNIVLHGYRGGPGSISVEVELAGDDLVVRLRDRAPTFDPTQVPPPDLTLPLETRPIGGLGVYLTRQMMDGVSHRALPQGGNELTLVKKAVRPSGGPTPRKPPQGDNP